MKTAICYYSRHHGNTLKVLEAMAEAAEIDLIGVTSRMAARLPRKVLCRHHRSSKGQKLPHSWHLLLPRL